MCLAWLNFIPDRPFLTELLTVSHSDIGQWPAPGHSSEVGSGTGRLGGGCKKKLCIPKSCNVHMENTSAHQERINRGGAKGTKSSLTGQVLMDELGNYGKLIFEHSFF